MKIIIYFAHIKLQAAGRSKQDAWLDYGQVGEKFMVHATGC